MGIYALVTGRGLNEASEASQQRTEHTERQHTNECVHDSASLSCVATIEWKRKRHDTKTRHIIKWWRHLVA